MIKQFVDFSYDIKHYCFLISLIVDNDFKQKPKWLKRQMIFFFLSFTYFSYLPTIQDWNCIRFSRFQWLSRKKYIYKWFLWCVYVTLFTLLILININCVSQHTQNNKMKIKRAYNVVQMMYGLHDVLLLSS